MKTTNATAIAALGLVLTLAGARMARAQVGVGDEDRAAAALETIMTDAAVDGVAACASSEYHGWTARSQPGGMFFECLRKPGDKTGDPKAYLPADAVQKALTAQGLSYYADYSIYDAGTKTTLDRATIDRAAARAVQDRKAKRALSASGAALPKS
jgi:hypothetical protein